MLDVKYFMILPRLDYVGSPYDSLQWAALLKCISALEMYRKSFHRITPRQVAAFLILDADFPRSIRFCLRQIEMSLHQISGSPAGTFTNLAEQRVGRLRSELDFTNIDEIIGPGLHEYLDHMELQLNEIGSAIQSTFFDRRPTPQNPPAPAR
jgi:uncharacterized alpha-E superfamily protein